MPENVLKMPPRSASPVARAGAGDISERELSRERCTLQSTPPARLQPVHPKKQLFFTPVNKFTASCCGPSPHLDRIRSCLEEYSCTPVKTVKRANLAPKASSMEDLTPIKRMKNDNTDHNKGRAVMRLPGLYGIAEEEAAARVAKFMVVAAWRRRREEVRCVRKTLEFQVSCSERLRMQVCALKSLLDSDNVKVRLAMRELDRLKQLLKEKDAEKAVLEREKIALEDDICAAEDRASEYGIGWRNCRNELDAVSERALAAERASRDKVAATLSELEEAMAQQDELLSAASAAAAAHRREADDAQRAIDELNEQLRSEREARRGHARMCDALAAALAAAGAAAEARRARGEALAAELDAARLQLQLACWPAPLTRMVSAARRWLAAAVLWSAVPPTHGAAHLARGLL